MSRSKSVLAAMLTCVFMALAGAGALAAAAPSKGSGGSADATVVTERVDALEKENLVLREDLGKARLETRTQLEAAAKREAEARARLQRQIDELNAKLQEERDRQARRNRNLWYAVGALALGLILSN